MTNQRRMRSLVRVLPVAILITAVTTLMTGCNDAQAGSLLGASMGALAGQAIGGDSEATLIGAAVGAGAGYIIGNEQDKARYGGYGYGGGYGGSPYSGGRVNVGGAVYGSSGGGSYYGGSYYGGGYRRGPGYGGYCR